MNKRERTIASIKRKALDAIPWQFDLTSAIAEKLKLYYGTDDLLTALDDHFVVGCPRKAKGFIEDSHSPELMQDEFGSVWRKEARDRNVGDWGGLEFYPLTEPCLDNFKFPDGSTSGRWDHIPELRKKHPSHFLMTTGFGLFEMAWALCGFENYLRYIMSEQKFVEELTEKLADFSCAVTRQLKGLGVDGIRFGDDWGFQNTLMMQPDVWRRLFKKSYKLIYEEAHKLGAIVMIHSCGNITDILSDLIEIGVEVVHPLQPEAMDVRYCQHKFGQYLSFWGGLGTQSTLPNGTSDDNRLEARERLKLFKNGGYILASAGAITPETPVENIAAIVEVAKEQLKDS